MTNTNTKTAFVSASDVAETPALNNETVVTGRAPSQDEATETSMDDDALTLATNAIEDAATDKAVTNFLISGQSGNFAVIFGAAAILGGSYRAAVRGDAFRSDRDKEAFDGAIVAGQTKVGVIIHRENANTKKAKAKAEAEMSLKREFFDKLGDKVTDEHRKAIALVEDTVARFAPDYFATRIRSLNAEIAEQEKVEGSNSLDALIGERSELVKASLARTGWAEASRVQRLRTACFMLAGWMRDNHRATLASMASMNPDAALETLTALVEANFGDHYSVSLVDRFNERKPKASSPGTASTGDAIADDMAAEKEKAEAAKRVLQKERDTLAKDGDTVGLVMSYVKELNATEYAAFLEAVSQETVTRNKIDGEGDAPAVKEAA